VLFGVKVNTASHFCPHCCMSRAVSESVQQSRVNTKICLAEAGNSRREFNQSAFGGTIENAKSTSHGQSQTTSLLHAFPFIHEHEICF
jgi:hypothetical protein